jgi:hypothetical protein
MVANFPWFASRLGWAWVPITLEGRLLTLATFTLLLAIVFVHGGTRKSAMTGAGVMAFFLAVILMTSRPMG